MLQGAERELPVTWSGLILQTKNLNSTENAKYQGTYFYKRGIDIYVLTCLIKSQSDYFLFSFNLLQWEKDIYILRFYKEVRKYNSIEEVELNLFSIVEDETDKEIKDIGENLKDGELLIAPQTN